LGSSLKPSALAAIYEHSSNSSPSIYSWYEAGLLRLPRIRRWRVVKGGERNGIEDRGLVWGFLKRRVKDFDRYFPTKDLGLRSLRRWPVVYSWWYNWNLQQKAILN